MGAWSRTWIIAVGLVAFTAGLLLLARELGWPISPEWWTQNGAVALPALFIFGGLSLLANWVNSIVVTERLKDDRRQRLVESYCHALIVDVEEASGHFIPLVDLGVHVWKPGRRLWNREPVLKRYAMFRTSRRMGSGVEWTYGKGAIGQCWKRQQILSVDLSPLHAAAAEGQETFEGLSDEERWNIGWPEFQNTTRYWSILVWPLRNDHHDFLGCVSVDSTKADSFTDLGAAVRNRTVEATIELIRSAMAE